MSLKHTIIFVALVSGAGAAIAENLQGHAKGFITPTIGLTQNGAPLLQSFYFRFTSEDHHFGAIEAVPNLPAVNKASLGFTDKNLDDRYFYNVTFVPYFGEIFRRVEGREFCKGSCTYPLQTPANLANHVFVLRGFYIYYHGGDHHIDQIKVQESNGQVTVALNDDDNDDRFLVDLHYAYIPRARFAEISSRSGVAKGGARADIRSGTAVIRGFNFDFKGDIDRHIKEVGVMMNGSGKIETYFGDKEPTESFDWRVDYAVLNP